MLTSHEKTIDMWQKLLLQITGIVCITLLSVHSRNYEGWCHSATVSSVKVALIWGDAWLSWLHYHPPPCTTTCYWTSWWERFWVTCLHESVKEILRLWYDYNDYHVLMEAVSITFIIHYLEDFIRWWSQQLLFSKLSTWTLQQKNVTLYYF